MRAGTGNHAAGVTPLETRGATKDVVVKALNELSRTASRRFARRARIANLNAL
jgi:hypothetical protein